MRSILCSYWLVGVKTSILGKGRCSNVYLAFSWRHLVSITVSLKWPKYCITQSRFSSRRFVCWLLDLGVHLRVQWPRGRRGGLLSPPSPSRWYCTLVNSFRGSCYIWQRIHMCYTLDRFLVLVAVISCHTMLHFATSWEELLCDEPNKLNNCWKRNSISSEYGSVNKAFITRPTTNKICYNILFALFLFLRQQACTNFQIIALFTVNLKCLRNNTVKHRREAISGTSCKTSWFSWAPWTMLV